MHEISRYFTYFLGDINIRDLFLGFAISFAASWLLLWAVNARMRYLTRKRFLPYAGLYKGYVYEKEGDWTLKNNPQSTAVVRYDKKRQYLTIDLKNNGDKVDFHWTGIMKYDYGDKFSVSWHYVVWGGVRFGEKRHMYGYKRALLICQDDKRYIYLRGEEPFKEEVLIKE